MEEMKIDFYSKWEKQRKKKWLYVFLHGSIYLGLPIGTLIYLLKNNFTIDNLHFSDYIESIVFSAILGFVIMLLDFNRRDKIYLIKDTVDILNGIEMLKTGKVWRYENLRIKKENNETLIVKYELFCADKSNIITEKLNKCYDMIIGDFQTICENEEFKEFSKNSKVKIQIFDVLENQTPLLDKDV